MHSGLLTQPQPASGLYPQPCGPRVCAFFPTDPQHQESTAKCLMRQPSMTAVRGSQLPAMTRRDQHRYRFHHCCCQAVCSEMFAKSSSRQMHARSHAFKTREANGHRQKPDCRARATPPETGRVGPSLQPDLASHPAGGATRMTETGV